MTKTKKAPSRPTITIGTTTPLPATAAKQRPSKPNKRPTTVAGTNERIDIVTEVIENDRSEFDKAMEVIAKDQAAQDMALAKAKDERTALANAVAKGQEQTTEAFKAAATARQDMSAKVNGNTKAINKMGRLITKRKEGFGMIAVLFGIVAGAIAFWYTNVYMATMTTPQKWMIVVAWALLITALVMATAPREPIFEEEEQKPTTEKKEEGETDVRPA